MASSSSSSRDKKPAGRILTLSDLNCRSGPDSDSDDNDNDNNPQEYYTGGEKSGMLVQDPSKFNDVDAIFNQARQLGAVRARLASSGLQSCFLRKLCRPHLNNQSL